jgi:hypothetical protein
MRAAPSHLAWLSFKLNAFNIDRLYGTLALFDEGLAAMAIKMASMVI